MYGSTLRVLLVEDNPADARLIELYLGRAGATILTARAQTPEEARLSLAAGIAGEPPDVVLLDMGLPGISSDQTVRWMQSLAPDLPIVVLSGESDEQISIQAVRDGAQDYLVKGRIDPELLTRSIRYAIERKRAQVALKASEDRFASFMERSPTIAFIKDAQGRYLYANRLFEQTLGLQAGQWRDRRDDDLLPRHAAEPMKANDAAVLLGGRSIEIHEIIPGVDGDREWLTFKFPFTTATGQKHLAGMAVDITLRVRAEEALREAEAARLEAVQLQSDTLNALPAHVALIDSEANIIVVNEAWRQFSINAGATEGSLSAPWNYLRVLERSRQNGWMESDLIVAGLRQVLDAKTSNFTYEYRCEAPGQSPRWFNMVVTALTGSVRRGAVVMHLDITDRRRTEELLAQSEQRYRRIVDTAQEGIWVTDVAGRTSLVNQRMASMLGYEPSEMVGQQLNDFACISEAKISEMTESARPGEPVQYEMQLRHRDGRDVWVSIASCGMSDDRGTFEGTLRMVNDITNRKKAERALRETEDQLRQSQKMEAVGQLAGGIAHDFSNLLTAIRGYASLTRSSLSEGHAALESLAQVEEAALQATGVARALLTFAGKKRAEMRPVRMTTIVEQSARLFRRTLGPKITFATDADGASGLWINGDETQLHQVITNLALNARDAIEGTGSISVGLKPVPRPAAAAASATASWVAIIVRDNGQGMAPEILSRIFEPFFSTKPRSSGTGLGLPVIHGIVQEHGGFIEVQSAPGKGSTFRVLLPTVPSPFPVVESKPGATPEGRRQPPGPVMVVQNSPMVRGVVASMLAALDYEIVHAANMAEATTRSASMGKPIGLLVADLNLQDGTGLELFQSLSLRWPRLCGILIADVMSDE
ncbi:MAG: PAS domain S-box protein [Planctomycetota bacterium]|nr:PAS domain S-box protein [Planctomycetota bacterium]